MSEANKEILPPAVLWAQRNNILFLTVLLEDCKSPEIKISEDRVFFKGTGGTEKRDYEVTMVLFKEVNPDKSKYFIRDRVIEFILKKKEDGPYWPRLLNEKKKYHWLKVDFNKWRDEDDSEEDAGENQDLEEMMRQMGGLGGSGNKPNLDDLDAEEDSDDEDLPDLE